MNTWRHLGGPWNGSGIGERVAIHAAYATDRAPPNETRWCSFAARDAAAANEYPDDLELAVRVPTADVAFEPKVRTAERRALGSARTGCLGALAQSGLTRAGQSGCRERGRASCVPG